MSENRIKMQYLSLRRPCRWRDILIEDVFLLKACKSRQSSKYDDGKFSTVMDAPTHHFNEWVATVLSG
jgi:hypothetical protein